MIRVYTQVQQGKNWLQKYRGSQPIFSCILGFTDTGLIPGISAAGATPKDRQYTCLADVEFLYNGLQPQPKYPLPPLNAGASPVLITKAVIDSLNIPYYLFNAGLTHQPTVPTIDLGGTPARCLTSGHALDIATVQHLLKIGNYWGRKLADETKDSYIILGECVVGGTTTALAVLLGLGIAATGKVNSSHPQCNHSQKLAVVRQGLQVAFNSTLPVAQPLKLIAAVGDPMQIVVAGMAMTASLEVGVMLAGGTQMLAVYALMQALAKNLSLGWQPENIVVGTTRWVAEDPTGDTVGLAAEIGSVPLMATQLSFAESGYPQLQAYERGFVKEGVGCGGCAIAANLYRNWHQSQLLKAIEDLFATFNISRIKRE
ncbi:nicotinate mononucleotide-dependent phosphoribosyltransferase CobT [Okeania sp.]|uniref:nicotinate mononucleotide-dependent phosphoribosyltransferase CobT n=1 Tax=Okeania sp. TaxID=3100323 RepID=UPI002B4B3F78|nr:TIGR00303 family protein [Okeania sp.]MEB3339632.1 TIGR00303 family protein [Okeania sp.]